MGSSQDGCDWQMLVLKDFKTAEGDCCVPTPGLFPRFLDPIASPVDPFMFFFEVPCSNAQVSALSAGLPWGWGTWQDACVEPPVLVWLHLFHKSTMLLPVFSWWPAGTLLLAALSRALSSSAAEHHVFTQATILAEAWDFFAHGRGWIRPFVFFRLFLWLSRSFWILSLPAGYLQALVAFHYINNFTVYYWVAVRPDPHSVLYPAYHPVYTSSGSWTFFFFFCFNKCKWTAKCQLWLSLLWYKGTLSWQSFFPVL